MRNLLTRLLAVSLAFIGTSATAGPINVLWYTGGVTNTPAYKTNIDNLIGEAAVAPGNNNWKITYWAGGAMPSGSYNSLVVASPQGNWNTYPNYRSLVAAAPAFGNRVMVTGQDADWHYLNSPGPSSFNGPQGFLIDSVNWAGSGSGLGAVLLGANSLSYAAEGGNILSSLSGLGTETNSTIESVTIPSKYRNFMINVGLTPGGLSNWGESAHNSWTGIDTNKWTAINAGPDKSAVTLVSAGATATSTLTYGTVNLAPFRNDMAASFTSNPGLTLSQAAQKTGGFDHFNWVQTVVSYPGVTIGIRPNDHSKAAWPTTLPFIDPVAGGQNGQPADSLPFYWDEGSDPNLEKTYTLRANEDTNTLKFGDVPQDSLIPFMGQSMSFITSLVGVNPDNSWVPLDTFDWMSNYNPIFGVGGGVSTPRSIIPSTTGEGGVFGVQPLNSPTDVPQQVLALWQSRGARVRSVPEPSTIFLFSIGLPLLLVLQRRVSRSRRDTAS